MSENRDHLAEIPLDQSIARYRRRKPRRGSETTQRGASGPFSSENHAPTPIYAVFHSARWHFAVISRGRRSCRMTALSIRIAPSCFRLRTCKNRQDPWF
jgi:hypothetical protein